MGFWEVVGVIAAALVALNSAFDALRGVTLAPVRFFRWLRRAIRAVDVIMSIPARLTAIEGRQEADHVLVAEHISVADRKTELLDSMARDLGVITPLVADVHHEVKHNGGSSIKDAVARIEAEQASVAKQLKITRPAKRGSAPA